MDNIDGMTGGDFEKFFAKILCQHGYADVQVTGRAGDGGIDILATSPEGIPIAVQCKRQKEKVGVGVVQHLEWSVEHKYLGREPWLVTTAYLSGPAKSEAIGYGIRVIDRDRLAELAAGITAAVTIRTPFDTGLTPGSCTQRIIGILVALAVLGGATFLLRAKPSQPHLPGKGCAAGYVCMYTVDGLINEKPEHAYYSYGCYDLHNEFGDRYILNSQTSSAKVILYKDYGCSGKVATIAHLDSWHGDISPIYSVLLTP